MSHEGSRGGGVPGAPGLDERLVIEVPGELVEKLDDVVDLLGFKSREEFARARGTCCPGHTNQENGDKVTPKGSIRVPLSLKQTSP